MNGFGLAVWHEGRGVGYRGAAFGRGFNDMLSGYRVFFRRFVKSFPVIADFLATGLVVRLPTALLAAAAMILASLSLCCALILDTVTRGRKEAKRLRYLALPGPIERRGARRPAALYPSLSLD